VKLKGNIGKQKDLGDIFAVFRDLKELPWSSCVLHSLRDKTTLVPAIQNFFLVFGIHLLELELEGNYKILPHLLSTTPNLKRLDASKVFYGTNLIPSTTEGELNPASLIPDPTNSYGNLNLRKLKRLRIEVNGQESVSFLQLLLTSSGSRLEYISVSLGNLCTENALSLASLIAKANIPYVSLSLTLNPIFNSLIEKKIIIRELTLTVYLDATWTTGLLQDSFGLVEKLLSCCCPLLEKLDIRCDNLDYIEFPLPTRLILPALPSLMCLTLSCDDSPDEQGNFRFPAEEAPVDYFHPFHTSQFPLLEKVVLKMGNPDRGDDFAPLFNFSHFDNVKMLVIEHYFGRREWARIFPYLKSLDANVEDEDGFQEILSTMTGVEDLTMHMSGALGDVNLILFEGLPLLLSLKGNYPFLLSTFFLPHALLC